MGTLALFFWNGWRSGSSLNNTLPFWFSAAQRFACRLSAYPSTSSPGGRWYPIPWMVTMHVHVFWSVVTVLLLLMKWKGLNMVKLRLYDQPLTRSHTGAREEQISSLYERRSQTAVFAEKFFSLSACERGHLWRMDQRCGNYVLHVLWPSKAWFKWTWHFHAHARQTLSSRIAGFEPCLNKIGAVTRHTTTTPLPWALLS